MPKIVDVERPDRPKRYGLRWYIGRKQKHQFFATKEERREGRARLEDKFDREGRVATMLTAAEALEYARAKEKLKQARIRLSVLDAVEDYIASRPANAAPEVSLGKAVAEYLDRQGSRVSPAHLRQIKRAMDSFTANFSRLVASPKEIRAWLDGLGFEAQTVANYRKRLSSFYNFCVRNEWIDRNPVSAVEAPEVIQDEVGILTPEEARYLFRAGIESRPEVLARLALEAFAGLRNSSAARVSIEDIRFENRGIELPAAKLKTKRRHYIDGLPGNLWKWLELCRETAGDWTLHSRNYLYHKTAVFQAADALSRSEGRGGVPHPKNALRHSFATYHVSLHKAPGKTAAILCHKSEKKLWDHYRGKATEAEAREYFSIEPEGLK